ncbi:MAG TPA: 50S ribosomal protein L35 [Candidatus Ignatzschineria merdigallinarum]|uniref:Large ribosomal subunit protein bL35 n=1 Tax=Candidatus Ignatzschineria merdigallinarum TaxID=2838621 RepID=A0A9D1Q4I1_9GAMM|nr:50S ribosomal protein L35 [Candidatus Ignatzschineria merdigallinarum]
MPKLKTHSGAKKRFRKNASGSFKRQCAFRSHILTKKSTKRKRHLRGEAVISKADHKQIAQLLPNA